MLKIYLNLSKVKYNKSVNWLRDYKKYKAKCKCKFRSGTRYHAINFHCEKVYMGVSGMGAEVPIKKRFNNHTVCARDIVNKSFRGRNK